MCPSGDFEEQRRFSLDFVDTETKARKYVGSEITGDDATVNLLLQCSAHALGLAGRGRYARTFSSSSG